MWAEAFYDGPLRLDEVVAPFVKTPQVAYPKMVAMYTNGFCAAVVVGRF